LSILVSGNCFGAAVSYFQVNLTSDISGLAANTDPNLKNPWGMSFSATSPFWLSDQVTGVSTLYSGAGVPNSLVVTTPPASPTGQVFAGGLGFQMGGGAGNATFIFSTLSGTIDAWNGGTAAAIQFTALDGAVYTGLAQLGSELYAADTRNNKIDVFNNTFQKITPTGTFVDPAVPAGLTPYDIQTINGQLYVEYARRNTPGGFVSVFDANGNLLRHIDDPHLNSPWGVTLAPAGFGQFANDLLVGNFGDGKINAFDPVTGAFLGTLSDQSGNPIVNSGLWAIHFRAPGSGFDSNALFFAAGINGEANGLFGAIDVVPEPATVSTAGLVFAACALVLWRRRAV
jgi:uncharacterized protein (TIGR03118 family)